MTNSTFQDTRFSGVILPVDMDRLYQAAEWFGFQVDVRGAYPIMVSGMKAVQYTGYDSLITFLSRTDAEAELSLMGAF